MKKYKETITTKVCHIRQLKGVHSGVLGTSQCFDYMYNYLLNDYIPVFCVTFVMFVS